MKNNDEVIKQNEEKIELEDETVKEDKDNLNQIKEEKEEKKIGDIGEDIDDEIIFADNINNFVYQKAKTKISFQDSPKELINNKTKEEKINEIILSKDLSENEKNQIINQILNE